MRRYELDINGKHFSVAVRAFSHKHAELEIGGTNFDIDVCDVIMEGEEATPFRPARATARSLADTAGHATPAPPTRSTGIVGHPVPAPIPGQITALLVQEGDIVAAAQPLLKMEAMKMENTILARVAGTVATVGVHVGDVVMQGQELLVIA